MDVEGCLCAMTGLTATERSSSLGALTTPVCRTESVVAMFGHLTRMPLEERRLDVGRRHPIHEVGSRYSR